MSKIAATKRNNPQGAGGYSIPAGCRGLLQWRKPPIGALDDKHEGTGAVTCIFTGLTETLGDPKTPKLCPICEGNDFGAVSLSEQVAATLSAGPQHAGNIECQHKRE